MTEAPIEQEPYLPEERGSALEDLMAVVRARFWTILTCVVVVFTIFAVRTFRATPIYEASARIQIERQMPHLALTDFSKGRAEKGQRETQIKLITSKAVLQKAVEDKRLAKLFEQREGLSISRPGLWGSIVSEVKALFGGEPARPSEPWERLRGLVSAEPVEKTNLIDINVRHTDPQRAATIANVVAEAYVAHRVATRKTTVQETFEMLQKQKIEQEKALKKAEDELEAFREAAGVLRLGDGAALEDPASDRLRRLSEQYTSVQMLRVERGVAAQAIAKALEDGADVDKLLGIRIVRTDPAVESLEDRIGELEVKIQTARKSDSPARAVIVPETIRNAIDGKPVVKALLAIPSIASDPAVRAVRDQMTEIELTMKTVRKTYGPKHPKIAALEERKAYLEPRLRETLVQAAEMEVERRKQEADAEIEQRKKEIIALAEEKQYLLARLDGTVVRVAKALQAEYDQLLAREKKLEQELKDQNQVALELAKKSHRYNRLRRNVDRQTRLFGVILDRLKEVDLTREAGVTDVSLAEEAVPPRSFVSPNRKRSLVLGGVLGLILGLGLAFFLEHLDDTVKTPDEVEARVGMPSLGYVPEIVPKDGAPNGFAGRATHCLTRSAGSASEAFRSIRTNVYFSGELGQMKSVHVTSSSPGEGKTILATNLAITLAREGKRVLLVDADLRRPMIHEAFGFDAEPGLTNLLVEGGNLEELVRTPPETADGKTLDNLHILTAGKKAPNPAELLGGEAMAAFMRNAAEQYDAVIYDSCPVPFLADNAPLCANANGTILVLRSGQTRREAAQRAGKQVQTVHGKLIGAVVNQVRSKTLKRYHQGYYYFDHRDFHQYYAERGTSGDQ